MSKRAFKKPEFEIVLRGKGKEQFISIKEKPLEENDDGDIFFEADGIAAEWARIAETGDEYTRLKWFAKNISRRLLAYMRAHDLPLDAGDENFCCLLRYIELMRSEAFRNTMIAETKRAQLEQETRAREKAEIRADVYREDMHKAMSDCDKLKKGMSGRQKIPQELAAKICGVTVQTIRNWERGEGTPTWYRGRDMSVVEFKQIAISGRHEKKMQATMKKALKKPVSLDRLENL